MVEDIRRNDHLVSGRLCDESPKSLAHGVRPADNRLTQCVTDLELLLRSPQRIQAVHRWLKQNWPPAPKRDELLL